MVTQSSQSNGKVLRSLEQYYHDMAPGFYLIPPGVEWRWDPSVIGLRSAYFHPIPQKVVLVTFAHQPKYVFVNVKRRWEFLCVFYDEKKKLLGRFPLKFDPRDVAFCENTTALPAVPSFVYVSRNDIPLGDTSNPPWLAPIVDLDKRLRENGKNRTHELVLCLGPLMREQNWLLFIQFFEYYRIHGVTKFYVPTRFPLSQSSRRLLNYYAKLGLVEIDSWQVDFPVCIQRDWEYCSQTSQISECVMRSAYQHRYVLLGDFDELIQPVDKSLTLLDFINRHMEKDQTIGKLKIINLTTN